MLPYVLMILVAVILTGSAFLTSLTSDSDGFNSHDDYPEGYYPNRIVHEWTITVSSGKVIDLVFVEFDVQVCTGCHCDYVEVFDGLSVQSPLIGRICGKGLPEDARKFRSTGNELFVRFRTNRRIHTHGFKAHYDAVQPENPFVEAGKCGKPMISPQMISTTRIVGGDVAVPHSWPWMVSVTTSGGSFCGGSIIDNSWILTAAHCVEGVSDGVTVKVGAHDWRSTLEGSFEVRSSVIFTHPSYSSTTYVNDFALIRLSSSVQFNDKVSAICLPTSTDPSPEGKLAVTTGWGTRSEGDAYLSRELQQVMVHVFANQNCSSLIEWGESYDAGTMLCAGEYSGGKDSCQGDSGGPLVISDVDQVFTQIGVTSWGFGCARPQEPGVYARVSHARVWIDETMAKYI